jgi:hypothetical protein
MGGEHALDAVEGAVDDADGRGIAARADAGGRRRRRTDVARRHLGELVEDRRLAVQPVRRRKVAQRGLQAGQERRVRRPRRQIAHPRRRDRRPARAQRRALADARPGPWARDDDAPPPQVPQRRGDRGGGDVQVGRQRAHGRQRIARGQRARGDAALDRCRDLAGGSATRLVL